MRKVFYSFHYKPDNWRVATVRNIGTIEGNKTATDNDWESITSGPNSEKRIKAWIDEQMTGKSCTVVLIGSNTANRKWINYEIVESWRRGKGVVGIHVNGLKNSLRKISTKSLNPFDFIPFDSSGKMLSSVVKCYTPGGSDSKEKYAWISKHLANAVEEAIGIRNQY